MNNFIKITGFLILALSFMMLNSAYRYSDIMIIPGDTSKTGGPPGLQVIAADSVHNESNGTGINPVQVNTYELPPDTVIAKDVQIVPLGEPDTKNKVNKELPVIKDDTTITKVKPVDK